MTIPEPLLLYDGECGVCGAAVRFVRRHDPRGTIHLAPLDSDLGRAVLATIAGPPPDSLVLYDGGRAMVRSTAVFAVLRRLGGAWHLLRIGQLIPRPLADAAYDLVARHRGWISERLGLTCHIVTDDGERRTENGTSGSRRGR